MEIGTTSLGIPITLSDDDRRRHIYINGQTGTGKTTLMGNMMWHDLMHGRAFAFIDPNGDQAIKTVDSTPPPRTNDVLYFNPLDPTHVVGYNPLRTVSIRQRSQLADNLLTTFEARWADSWGARMSYILGHALRLLLDNDSTLLDINELLINERYRAQLLRRSTDRYNYKFWTEEYASWSTRDRSQYILPIQNKAGVFTRNSNLRAIVGQTHSTLNISHLMNRGKYLVANLDKAMGEQASHLIGSFLTTGFSHGAIARSAIPEHERIDFTLYVDEFQNFANTSFAFILSEARKYRLNLVLANQHLSQVPKELRESIFGNVGTVIVFRVGAIDAPEFGRQLGMPTETLVDTPNYHAWVKCGAPATAQFMHTDPPRESLGRFAAVQARTRARHAVPRHLVEKRITPRS